MGFVFATVIGGINVVPAFSEEGNWRNKNSYNDRHEQRRGGHDRDYNRYDRRRNEHDRYQYNRHGYYRSYGHRERVYIPAPIPYLPPRQPGIDIFLPNFEIRF